MATTMDSYAPFDSGAGANVTESGWRSMQRRIGNPGVIAGALNSMEVYADATGMQVKVKTGEVWVEGHWGSSTTEKTLAIATAHATLARKDLVIWRADYVNNRIELDVLTGTAASSPDEPSLTRTSSVFEGPLAIVDVPAADTSIGSTQVLDARWWGGPPSPTLVDDNTVFGDKISTVPRNNASATSSCTSGIVYLASTIAQRTCVVSNIKYFLGTARSGGSAAARVYTGYSRHRIEDVTGDITLSDTSSANSVHIDALPSTLTIEAGQFVAIGYRQSGAGTAPTLAAGGIAVNVDILNNSALTLDPLGRWSTIFQTTTFASTIQVHVEGTWSKRDRAFWFALG